MIKPALYQCLARAAGPAMRAVPLALALGFVTVAASPSTSRQQRPIGAPVKLAFIQQPPVNVNGGARIRPALKVALQDSTGAIVPTAVDTITLSVQSGPAGGAISGRISVAALGGTAAFDSVAINLVGDYTLVAVTQASGVESATSNMFTVRVGPPAKLGFTVQPTNTLKGSLFVGLPPTVAVQDSGGNVVDGAKDYLVRLTLATNPGNAKLTGDTVRTNNLSLAQFRRAKVDLPGEGYTFMAATTAPGIAPTTSTAFAVRDPGPPTRLKVFSGPGLQRQTADSTPTSATIAVAVLDTGGVPVPAATKAAAVSLALVGGLPKQLRAGPSTFDAGTGLVLIKPTFLQAGRYRLIVSSALPGVAPDTTPPFTVGVGVAHKLQTMIDPQGTAISTPFSPSILVRIVDKAGSPVTSATHKVTAELKGRAGSSAALSGRVAVEAVNGVATFDSLVVSAAGEGYRVIFRGPGLVPDTTQPFKIGVPGPAARLHVLSTPKDLLGGSTISPPIRVVATDSAGIVVGSWADAITMTLAGGPPGAVLEGKKVEEAVNGAATFSNLVIPAEGTGYRLVATAADLQSESTQLFDVTAGPADHFRFVTQPANYTFMAEMPATPSVAVVDRGGNVVESATDSIVLSVNPNFPLKGTIAARAIRGIASFPNLRIDGLRPGRQATLVASSAVLPRLTPGVSATFTATAGAAAKLKVVELPTLANSGARFTSPVKVAVLDANGNRVNGDRSEVSLSIGANPGKGILGGPSLRSRAVDGVATFDDLTISRLGIGYTLVATGALLVADTSRAFTVIGPAYKLVFTHPPDGGLRNGPMSATVQVQDSLGTPRNAGNAEVTLSLEPTPGSKAMLAGPTKVNAKSASASASPDMPTEAQFTGLRVTEEGHGFRLIASAPRLALATSPPFDLAGYGPPRKLAFITAVPVSNPGAMITPSVEVAVMDSVGNIVFTATEPVQLALDANSANATLGGTAGKDAVAGVATFTGLTVSALGKGYVLRATSGSLAPAASRPFAVVEQNMACKLAFAQAPTKVTAGQPIVPAIAVQVQRCDGGPMATATDTVTIAAIGDNATGQPSTLTGTVTTTPTAGVATFDSLRIAVADNYRLQATAPGLTPARSAMFAVAAGPPTQLLVENAPDNFIAGVPMTGKLRVRIADAHGNRVETAANSVVIGLECMKGTSSTQSLVVRNLLGQFGEPGACVQPKAAVGTPAVRGLVEFELSKFTPRGAAEETRFVFTSPPLTEAKSSAIAIAPSAPTRLGFEGVTSGEPKVANINFSGIQVAIRDSIGNNVPAGSELIVLEVDSGTTGKLAGNTQARASNGVATFGSLMLTAGGGGVRLRATAPGLEKGVSPPFPVAEFKEPKRLQFVVQPVNTAPNTTMAPIQVAVQDEAGNVVKNARVKIKLTLMDLNGVQVPMRGDGPERTENGIATFRDVRINTAGTGYTIQASAEQSETERFPDVASTTFDIAPLPPATAVPAKPAGPTGAGAGGARQERHLH